ncbi:MAG: response regulator [Actinomycetota bacterium]
MRRRSPIRIVLCDDVAEVRTMLRVVLELEDDFAVVGEASDGREAVESAARHRPDVLVLDLYMPVMNGLEAIPEIRETSPETRIVVLSGIEAPQAADEAMARGATAYIEKGTAADDIVEVLREAAHSAPPGQAPAGGGSGGAASFTPEGPGGHALAPHPSRR